MQVIGGTERSQADFSATQQRRSSSVIWDGKDALCSHHLESTGGGSAKDDRLHRATTKPELAARWKVTRAAI